MLKHFLKGLKVSLMLAAFILAAMFIPLRIEKGFIAKPENTAAGAACEEYPEKARFSIIRGEYDDFKRTAWTNPPQNDHSTCGRTYYQTRTLYLL